MKKLEDIKVGETYNVRLKFTRIDSYGDRWFDVPFDNEDGREFCLSDKEVKELVTRLDSNKKYDPCREFMNGDKVRMVMRDGRYPYCNRMREHIVPSDTILTVAANLGNGLVAVRDDKNPNEQVVGFYFLELVTPVEELEPYSLEEEAAFSDDEPCGIIHIYYNYNGGRDKVRTFYENGPESWNATKAAAEAERDRLNDEYRKEQE